MDQFFFFPPLTVGISSQLIKKQTQQQFILGILMTNGFLKENYFNTKLVQPMHGISLLDH